MKSFLQFHEELKVEDNWCRKVPGSHGETYTVCYSEDFGWLCDCKAFHFSKDGTCKHIEAIKQELSSTST